jgi:hypothetical protein
MIEIGGQITVQGQIIIGDIGIFPIYFITEDDNFLVSETNDNFVDQQGPPYNV